MRICTLILLLACLKSCISVEFLSAALVGLGSFAAKYSYCKFKECCSANEIPGDIKKLAGTLKEKVYGQHLVQDTVVNAIAAHWYSDHAQKPLTMSFHGWPGGGKNYVSHFIEESLYKYGRSSRHVHHFMGRIHFPLVEKTEEYKKDVYAWVKGNVTRCGQQLFIFDEVDKMPPGVLDGIKNVLDYNTQVENVDYRKAIFIFLSNTGASLITKHMLTLWKQGVPREDITLHDFEHLITKGAFNEEGGFQYSDTIKSNLIDHYVPFLPLEEKHVRLCIIDEFKSRGIIDPGEEHIKLVLDSVEWGPAPENLYSKTGCKRLSQKVALTVAKYYA